MGGTVSRLPEVPGDSRSRALHTTNTPIGDCFTHTVGSLLPADDRHAPIKHYRSFGQWWEAGMKARETHSSHDCQSSRYWPYGRDVTKVYQMHNIVGQDHHKYSLDSRTIAGARPYIPPRLDASGSLPDLRSTRGSARSGRHLDDQYTRSFFHGSWS